MNLESPNTDFSEKVGEKIERDALVEFLRGRDFSDPEALKLLDRYQKQQEILADATKDSKGRLEVNLDLALMYRDAGWDDFAWEAFEAIRMEATMEGNEELVRKVEKIQDDMEGVIRE
jgi:hypothetical protein